MVNKDNIAIGLFFLVLAALTAWLQFEVLRYGDGKSAVMEKDDPDYYINNFVSTGLDKTGKKYQVMADRLVHYPEGDRALLDNPHIIQYNLATGLRHVYADSGWLYNNRSTVLLDGNVRVLQGGSGNPELLAIGKTMTIHLKENRG
ncbi:MAG: LPS export ABC transporter periplasmic protein LptC [Gammaproteobacteria bacterium]|nr:LPS export ABC transporter periplasmic protein LptC [Gammaproteobacteria bacterium]